eukprot:Opistho-2@36111
MSPSRELTIAIASMYGSLIVVVLFQLARIIYYRHRLVSFQVGFLVLCLVWVSIRTMFFALFEVDFSDAIESILYWTPINLEFATFSLLTVFFARIVHRDTWEQTLRARTYAVWALFNIVFLGVNIVWLITIGEGTSSHTLTNLRVIFTACIFLLLAVFVGIYAVRLVRVVETANISKLPMYLPPTATLFQIKLLMGIVFASIACRAIYDFVELKDTVSVPFSASSNRVLDVKSFVLMTFWEIVPVFLIVMFFRRIPRTRLGALSKRERDTTSSSPPLIAHPRSNSQTPLLAHQRAQTIVGAGSLSHDRPPSLSLYGNSHRYDVEVDESSIASYTRSFQPRMYDPSLASRPFATPSLVSVPGRTIAQYMKPNVVANNPANVNDTTTNNNANNANKGNAAPANMSGNNLSSSMSHSYGSLTGSPAFRPHGSASCDEDIA